MDEFLVVLVVVIGFDEYCVGELMVVLEVIEGVDRIEFCF